MFNLFYAQSQFQQYQEKIDTINKTAWMFTKEQKRSIQQNNSNIVLKMTRQSNVTQVLESSQSVHSKNRPCCV